MSNPIVIGRFGKVFGIKGWIKVFSFTTPRENILNFKPWLIRRNNSWQEIYIESSRIHYNHIIVKIPNCDLPEQARDFTDLAIGIWRDQLPNLEKDEYYWADLVGLKVVNCNGEQFGVVQELMATGSNDVLVVVGDSKYLIPYISNVICKIDLTEKIIIVDWERDFL